MHDSQETTTFLKNSGHWVEDEEDEQYLSSDIEFDDEE